MIEFTYTYLHDILIYNPNTGIFIWKDRKDIWPSANARLRGTIAGSPDLNGYIVIKIDGVKYQAHRLAYLYMTGVWPPHEIDHKNTNTGDNKWKNLRPATHSQNGQNRRISSRNTSGRKGVSWHKGAQKWASFIRKDKKTIYLGLFESKEEAYQVYCNAAKTLFGEFASL